MPRAPAITSIIPKRTPARGSSARMKRAGRTGKGELAPPKGELAQYRDIIYDLEQEVEWQDSHSQLLKAEKEDLEDDNAALNAKNKKLEHRFRR